MSSAHLQFEASVCFLQRWQERGGKCLTQQLCGQTWKQTKPKKDKDLKKKKKIFRAQVSLASAGISSGLESYDIDIENYHYRYGLFSFVTPHVKWWYHHEYASDITITFV